MPAFACKVDYWSGGPIFEQVEADSPDAAYEVLRSRYSSPGGTVCACLIPVGSVVSRPYAPGCWPRRLCVATHDGGTRLVSA